VELSPAALAERFAIPGMVRFEASPPGMVRAVVTAPAAEAHVYLHGAHVTHYRPAGGAPVLFLSSASRFAPGQPIRGGVPVCFPWFAARAGDPAAPAHGVARTATWTLDAVARDGEAVDLTLSLEADDATRRWWPHDFALRYRVRVGATLELLLEVENRSAGPVTFEEALHTYLAVSDVAAVSLTGLEGAGYVDKTAGGAAKREGTTPLRLDGETDRVYEGAPGACRVDDPGAGRRLVIEKAGSATTVVWNPGPAKGPAIPDLGPGEWRRMVCVETANAHRDAVTLAAGARHAMRAAIRAEPAAREDGRPRSG
jgi:glucose-6-phosphate 1-epimerase